MFAVGLAVNLNLDGKDAPEAAGTAGYMAPDVQLGGELTTLVDVWSLGCIMYEMVFSFKPFSEQPPCATMQICVSRTYVKTYILGLHHVRAEIGKDHISPSFLCFVMSVGHRSWTVSVFLRQVCSSFTIASGVNFMVLCIVFRGILHTFGCTLSVKSCP